MARSKDDARDIEAAAFRQAASKLIATVTGRHQVVTYATESDML